MFYPLFYCSFLLTLFLNSLTLEGMRKLLLLVFLIFFFFASLPLPIFAQQNLNPCITGTVAGTTVSNQFGILCTNVTQKENTPVIIRNFITVLFVVAVLLALFFLIRAGISWVTSGGDKAKVDAARQMIVAAVIGLIVTFLAYFIHSVVMGTFGLSLSNLIIPQIIPSGPASSGPGVTPGAPNNPNP